MNPFLSRIALLSLALAAIGCGPEMIPATPRPALGVEAVELYTKAPKKFEDHGIILTPAVDGINNFKADAYVDQLKTMAAAKGANGLLIAPVDEWKEYKGRDARYAYVGGYYKGVFYNFPYTTDKPASVGARAIFVIEK